MLSKDESKAPLAEELEFIGAGLQNLQYLDAVADHLQDISTYIKELAATATLKAILEHGSTKDKQAALHHLKSNSGCRFD